MEASTVDKLYGYWNWDFWSKKFKCALHVEKKRQNFTCSFFTSLNIMAKPRWQLMTKLNDLK
jgi:hypothetical protein